MIRVLAVIWLLLGPGCGSDDPAPSSVDSGPRATANPSVTLLQQLDLTLSDGRSPEIMVEVPQNVVAVTISVVGEAGDSYGICWWESPGGALVSDGWEEKDHTQCKSCKLLLLASAVVWIPVTVSPTTQAARVRNTFALIIRLIG
jgi:hypothetical protein